MDVVQLKKRRNGMMAVNVVAALLAIGAMALFVQGQTWALGAFVVAVLAGFGGQIWFMAGLRGKGGR